MSLKSIKQKIRSVGKTRQVTRAMEAVSAVKMRKSQERALTARPFALTAFSILKHISGVADARNHSLMKKRDVTNVLYVVITSDRGLAGSLNSAVLKKVATSIRERGLSQDAVSAIVIGRKGYEYMTKRGYRVLKYFEKMGDQPELSVMRELTDIATDAFLKGEVDEVMVVYQNFISTMMQEPSIRTLLPLTLELIDEVVAGITPVRGKYADLYEKHGEVTRFPAYTYEPSQEAVLGEVLTELKSVVFYHALLEAKASEYSARMVAMKSASDKALDMGKSLTRKFNKIRQSSITREVSEIIGGIEALK